ncbi:hypothetical protein KSS87_016918 [Heliosperma pusillum]|nr:hypothetical protein KSS87_016918 [Heliosperma pusillum]
MANIGDTVEVSASDGHGSMDNSVMLALGADVSFAEVQGKYKSGGSSREYSSPIVNPKPVFSPKTAPTPGSNNSTKITPKTSESGKETSLSKVRCFKCQGFGHYQSSCPNKRVVTLREAVSFREELTEEEERLGDVFNFDEAVNGEEEEGPREVQWVVMIRAKSSAAKQHACKKRRKWLNLKTISPRNKGRNFIEVKRNDHAKHEVKRIKREHPDDNHCIVNDRVKGRLKVTRAFGAGFLKQAKFNDSLLEMFRNEFIGAAPYVSCIPSLRHHQLGPRDQFLVLSSDGLYQYFSNQEVVSFVDNFLEKYPDGDPAQHLIEELLNRAAKKADVDLPSSALLGTEKQSMSDSVFISRLSESAVSGDENNDGRLCKEHQWPLRGGSILVSRIEIVSKVCRGMLVILGFRDSEAFPLGILS